MMRSASTVRTCSLMALAAFGAFVLAVQFDAVAASWVRTYEHAAFALLPSAERAYTTASKHFNAEHPAFYDIDLAEKYYKKTLEYDPSYPYVHHQLARIAFLHGDLDRALYLVNHELELHPDAAPSTYYVRALIYGYRGDYDKAGADYETFLAERPTSWAAHNDYAWVLLKAGKVNEAAAVADRGVALAPQNAWLLNASAIAHYELGDHETALERIEAAAAHVDGISKQEWLTAYPGNDPVTAEAGLGTLRTSIAENMHRIRGTVSAPAVE